MDVGAVGLAQIHFRRRHVLVHNRRVPSDTVARGSAQAIDLHVQRLSGLHVDCQRLSVLTSALRPRLAGSCLIGCQLSRPDRSRVGALVDVYANTIGIRGRGWSSESENARENNRANNDDSSIGHGDPAMKRIHGLLDEVIHS